MREVTVGIVQMKPLLGEPEENLVKMSEMIGKIASQQKVDLIVFPELITSGSELGVRFTEIAQRIPGPTVNLIAQRANDYGIFVAFGMVSKEKVESVLYNSAVLESVAQMALLTEQINPKAPRLKEALIRKHYDRKHGAYSYYGQ